MNDNTEYNKLLEMKKDYENKIKDIENKISQINFDNEFLSKKLIDCYNDYINTRTNETFDEFLENYDYEYYEFFDIQNDCYDINEIYMYIEKNYNMQNIVTSSEKDDLLKDNDLYDIMNEYFNENSIYNDYIIENNRIYGITEKQKTLFKKK